MQCPRCHTRAAAGARFCRHCGAPLEPQADPRRTATPAATATASSLSPSRDVQAGHVDEADTTTLPTPTGDGTSSVACRACGAPNTARRELCGRCGADLETGVVPPAAEDGPAPTPSRRPASAGRGGQPAGGLSLWLMAAGLLALVGAIVLGLSLAGLGPLAEDPSLPEAEFSSEAYGGGAAPLLLSEVAASTTLQEDGGESVDATRMVDGDATTAWVSDGSRFEDGVGETIDLFLAEPSWVERLVIDNGVQRDAESYADHGRIRRAELVVDGGERLSVRLEDLALQRQAIELPEPRLTTTVRLEITETFPGDSSPHLAVSHVGIEGWRARGEDIEVARERAERARASASTR